MTAVLTHELNPAVITRKLIRWTLLVMAAHAMRTLAPRSHRRPRTRAPTPRRPRRVSGGERGCGGGVLVAPDDYDVRSSADVARKCFDHSLTDARRSTDENRDREVGGLEGGIGGVGGEEGRHF